MSFDLYLFTKRIESIISDCENSKKIRYTFFLNEEQIFVSEKILNNHNNIYFLFFGGFYNSTRKMLAISSLNIDNYEDIFPLVIVRSKYSNFANITHRNVLGSIMSLNIKRELIGDIYIDDINRYIYIVCHKNAEYILINELNKISNSNVNFIKINFNDIKVLNTAQKFKDAICIVSSLRIDNVVSSLTCLSRKKSFEMIKNNFVYINYVLYNKTHINIHKDDILTIKKFGKFIIDNIDQTTKKGNIIIKYKKYI